MMEQVSLARGERRAKRILAMPPVVHRPEPPVRGPWQRDWRGSDPPEKTMVVFPAKEKGKGNLEFYEYRFWIGGEAAYSEFARCRACRAVEMGLEGRKTHHKRLKCSIWITRAVAKTQDWKVCVVCEKKTYDMKWGLYLCSEECQREWMFSPKIPPLWLKAIAMAKPEVAQVLEAAKKEWEGGHL